MLPEVTSSRVGGDVAVDFLNTVDWRLDPPRRSERLPTYPHLLTWMWEFELMASGDVETLAERAEAAPESAAAEHGSVLEMRDDTYDALIAGTRPEALEHRLTSAYAESRLGHNPDGTWKWVPARLDLSTPGNLVALEFARLVTSDAIARLHRCEDRDCGWVFLDTSRQRNRRWCSAADCGNRNRVRAHYQRSRRASAEGAAT